MIPKDPLSLIRENADPIQLLPVLNVKESVFKILPKRSQKLYVYDADSERYYIPDEVWASELRSGKHYGIKTTIGGSDVSAILDGSNFISSWHFYDGQHGSNYKCALELFHQKIGVTPELEANNDEYILWNGHNAEESVARKFLRAYKKDHPCEDITMINDTYMYQCGMKDKNGNLLYPFALGNFDRIIEINGVRGILEIKTSFFSAKDHELWQQGIVPLKYLVQVIYYLAISNLSYAYIACDMGYGEDDLIYIYIERNFEIEDDLMRMVQEFVWLIENGKEPDISNQDAELVYAYFRRLNGNFDPKKAGPVQLPEEYADELFSLYQLQEKKKDIDMNMERYKIERARILSGLAGAYGKASVAYCKLSDGRNIRLKMGTSRKRDKIDQEKLKDQDPELYRSYCTVFNESLFKKEQKGKAELYMLPPSLSGEDTYSSFKVDIITGDTL